MEDKRAPRSADTGTQKAVSCAFLPCVMSTSGRIHGDFLRLLHIIAHPLTMAHTGLPASHTGSRQLIGFPH